jgi:hypothetical protein
MPTRGLHPSGEPHSALVAGAGAYLFFRGEPPEDLRPFLAQDGYFALENPRGASTRLPYRCASEACRTRSSAWRSSGHRTSIARGRLGPALEGGARRRAGGGDRRLAGEIGARRDLYAAGRPYVEAPGLSPSGGGAGTTR